MTNPQEQFEAIHNLFPLTYRKIAEIIGTSENMVARKIADKEYAKYYKFTQEEVDKLINYIKLGASNL